MKTDLFAPASAPLHPFHWVIHPIEDDPSFLVRPMFGTHACWLHGRLVLALCGQMEEPWNGVLVPTERKHHASLRREFRALRPHAVLGKWLYLPAGHASFESTAEAVVSRVKSQDPRIGVEAKDKKLPREPEPPRSRTRAKRRRAR